MVVLLGFAFLAGLATILAPCIWPILPIVLTSSANSSKAKPLGITLGIILSFSFFTLFLSSIVNAFHINAEIFRWVSVVVIGFLGLSMLIPTLNLLTEAWVSRLSNLMGVKSSKGSSGFGGGLATGLSLGVIWAPCAGPILASIVALSAMGKISSTLILITLAYAIGAGVPLFVVSYGSQKLLTKVKGISTHTGTIQKVFGVIMILTAIAILNGWDVALSADLANSLPGFTAVSTGFETNSSVSSALQRLTGGTSGADSSSDDLQNLGPAPDFVGVTDWLNTPSPIHLSDLRGKVVLVDFWTYTCINCIRTLPFVTSWYDKYKDQGFVVIGMHTPEFAFEHDTGNVQNAIKMYNIHYPVAQDNNYATWNNYSNQYWPAEYLIDAQGNLRETHFGEGNYDQTERNIQELLKEAGKTVSATTVKIADQTPTGDLSPETYLGSNRAQYFYPGGMLSNGQRNFTLVPNIPTNSFTLGSQWNITPEYAITGQNAVLQYNFLADKVFLVLQPPAGKRAAIKVLLDGKVVDQSNAGADVKNGTITVDSDRLYNLIDLKGKTENHTLRLEFQTPGTKVYAFTFG